jgi:chromosome segregation ATPase
MPDFEQSLHDLNQARDASTAAREKRDAARRQLQRLEAQVAQAKRQANDDNPSAQQALGNLQAAQAQAANAFQAAGTAHLEAEATLNGRYADFGVFTDPTKFVEKLDDALPFLLFPVRVETRFKSGGGGQHELWVRIYPDDCLIDTFEPTLSGTEITAARRYYIESWKAG